MSKDFSEWDEVEKEVESKSGDYFKIVEGANRFILLSHIKPLAQVWDGSKYRIAEEGDKNVSVKGICWVLQKETNVDGEEEYTIKQAKLPYTIVKEIKGISEDPDWDFEFPFPYPITVTAKGAGTKEVKYSTNASPKKFEIPEQVTKDLAEKPTPEEIVEKIKAGKSDDKAPSAPDYPEEEIDPADIPF